MPRKFGGIGDVIKRRQRRRQYLLRLQIPKQYLLDNCLFCKKVFSQDEKQSRGLHPRCQSRLLRLGGHELCDMVALPRVVARGRRCKLKACSRPRQCKGYCRYHYIKLVFRSSKKCKYKDCTEGQRARGFCERHYHYLRNRCKLDGVKSVTELRQKDPRVTRYFLNEQQMSDAHEIIKYNRENGPITPRKFAQQFDTNENRIVRLFKFLKALNVPVKIERGNYEILIGDIMPYVKRRISRAAFKSQKEEIRKAIGARRSRAA